MSNIGSAVYGTCHYVCWHASACKTASQLLHRHRSCHNKQVVLAVTKAANSKQQHQECIMNEHQVLMIPSSFLTSCTLLLQSVSCCILMDTACPATYRVACHLLSSHEALCTDSSHTECAAASCRQMRHCARK